VRTGSTPVGYVQMLGIAERGHFPMACNDWDDPSQSPVLPTIRVGNDEPPPELPLRRADSPILRVDRRRGSESTMRRLERMTPPREHGGNITEERLASLHECDGFIGEKTMRAKVMSRADR